MASSRQSTDQFKAIRLDKTAGSFSTQELEAVRQHVASEVQAANAKQGDDATVVPNNDVTPSSSDQRLQKLDVISDVQLVLVEKYRRAARLMWAAIIMLFIGTCVGITAILYVVKVGKQMNAVVARQDKVLKAQEAANKKVDATNKAVAETKKKVTEAIKASPRVEINAEGKAKVVVPIRKTTEDSNGPKPATTGTPPPKSPSKWPPKRGKKPSGGIKKKGGKAEIPIELK